MMSLSRNVPAGVPLDTHGSQPCPESHTLAYTELPTAVMLLIDVTAGLFLMGCALPTLPLETNSSRPKEGSVAAKNNFGPAQTRSDGSMPASSILVPASVASLLHNDLP